MDTYDLAEAAERSGVELDELSRFVDLGILRPDADGRFTPGHLRRAGLVKGLTEAGISLEGLGGAIRNGQVSLDFLDAPAFARFSALGGDTFAELAERTGVPVAIAGAMLLHAASRPGIAMPGGRQSTITSG